MHFCIYEFENIYKKNGYNKSLNLKALFTVCNSSLNLTHMSFSVPYTLSPPSFCTQSQQHIPLRISNASYRNTSSFRSSPREHKETINNTYEDEEWDSNPRIVLEGDGQRWALSHQDSLAHLILLFCHVFVSPSWGSISVTRVKLIKLNLESKREEKTVGESCCFISTALEGWTPNRIYH